MADKGTDALYGIPNELWKRIQPLLPPELPKSRKDGPRMDGRRAMEAILYILRHDFRWESLPGSMGSPNTVRLRFREWQKAGVFQRMWQAGLLTYDEMREMVWYGKEWRMPPKR